MCKGVIILLEIFGDPLKLIEEKKEKKRKY